jgi:hypothetical protein
MQHVEKVKLQNCNRDHNKGCNNIGAQHGDGKILFVFDVQLFFLDALLNSSSCSLSILCRAWTAIVVAINLSAALRYFP